MQLIHELVLGVELILLGVITLTNSSEINVRRYLKDRKEDMAKIMKMADLGLISKFNLNVQDADSQNVLIAVRDKMSREFNFSSVPVFECDENVELDKLFDPLNGVLKRKKRQAPFCTNGGCLQNPMPVCNMTRRLSKPLFGYNPSGEFRVIVQMPSLEQCVEIIHCPNSYCFIAKGNCIPEYRLEQLMVFDPIQDIPFSDMILVPSGCSCRARITGPT